MLTLKKTTMPVHHLRGHSPLHLLLFIFICTSLTKNSQMGEPMKIKTACWNARGYLSSIPYIKKLLSDVDVLAISEHWLHSNRLNILNDISDSHDVFSRSSNASASEFYGSRRGQGGVAIFWRKSISGFSKAGNIIHDRACVVRYQPQDGEVYFFISVYLPAQGCGEDLNTVLDEISEIVEAREPGSHVIVLGDFNGDVGALGGPRGTRPPTPRGRYVMNFFDRHGLVPMNMQISASGPVDTFQCHNGHSTIDYISVSADLLGDVSRCHVMQWDALNTSDHNVIQLTIKVPFKTLLPPPIISEGKIKWDKFEVKQQYTRNIRQPLIDLSVKIQDTNISGESLDKFFEDLTGIMHDAALDLPRTRYVKHIKPFWNATLSALKKEKVIAYRRWVGAGRPRDPLHPLMLLYKSTKKKFATTLKNLAKQYESDEISKAARLAEVDRNAFWQLIRRCRNSNSSTSISIRNANGTVVNQVEEVLEVWRSHFANLGTPKTKPNFDDDHFRTITAFTRVYNDGRVMDDNFLDASFTDVEIHGALKKLNLGKDAGFDRVSAEHVINAGEYVIEPLRRLYNSITELEIIPSCFRNGVQIPLFKGKDLDSLDPNNYRGITLLSTFNKIFEILVWNRLKAWWSDEQVISELQGACKSGLSCIHTAFLLQETMAASMEANEQCFVAFFDVAKAFDTVWIDGLFKQLFDLGITGKTWRILYRGYIDFRCRVRVGGNFSKPYELFCGIHQGGYLSLLKYTVFINSLLVSLQNSGLCAKIYRTPCTPQGYADDLATCCISKRRTDAVMEIVYRHGCTWRYDFNARKSGILVFGENRREHVRNAKNRSFKLGLDRVKEVMEYDHVGVKTSIFIDSTTGVEERISKARRVLNATSGIGIRKNGLNIATCNIIFWTVVVPTALYGCELWRLNANSINILDSFQIYAGKKIQRLFSRSPNICSFYGLGWMRLIRLVQVKKLLFIRALMSLDDDNLSRRVFIERATEFFQRDADAPPSCGWSIVEDLLEVADVFNLTNEVRNMTLGEHIFAKSVWKNMVWSRGWSLEDTHWCLEARLHRELDLLTMLNPKSRYLTWWSLSNRFPETLHFCETLARIVSHASLLKCDDVRLKQQPRSNRVCSLCNLYAIEDIFHVTMQCPGTHQLREAMFNDLKVDPEVEEVLTVYERETLKLCLGKYPDDCDWYTMEKLWCKSGKHISGIYRYVLSQRQGVG